MPSKPRKLPATASVAIPQSGNKLHAPSAARNVGPIIEAIWPFAPKSGQALEIASGTGEHIIRYAAEFPALSWQPTDIAPERLASIDAWGAEAGVSNLIAARHLDASISGWAQGWQGQNLILFSNLLHLIAEREAETLLAEAAQALAAGGVFIIYGPFMRGTEFASEGDRSFHESLREQDPEIGYKPLHWVLGRLNAAGLKAEQTIDMPASNLLLVARKP